MWTHSSLRQEGHTWQERVLTPSMLTPSMLTPSMLRWSGVRVTPSSSPASSYSCSSSRHRTFHPSSRTCLHSTCVQPLRRATPLHSSPHGSTPPLRSYHRHLPHLTHIETPHACRDPVPLMVPMVRYRTRQGCSYTLRGM